MSKKYVKIMAVIVIYLVISLTFFAANAYAQFTYTVSGEDLVNGWRKANDYTLFDVNASSNVSVVFIDGDSEHMSCDQNYHCEYMIDQASTGLNALNFTLRHHINPPEDRKVMVKVDRLPPKIEEMLINSTMGILKVTYRIKDYSYVNSMDCSGLDTIQYTIGTNYGDINFNNSVCQDARTLLFNHSGVYDKDFPITFTVVDRLGQRITNTTIIELDMKGPEIDEEFSIFRGGEELSIFSRTANATVDIIVYVNDAKLDTDSVYGDLSSLNSNNAAAAILKDRKAICTLESESRYKCRFAGVSIRPRSETLQITVNARDKYNNTVTANPKKTITLINNAGEPSYIGPMKKQCMPDLSTCHVKNTPQLFILEINPGSSYNRSVITIVSGEQRKPATCRFEDDLWRCYSAGHAMPNEGSIKVYVATPSTDDYGNQIPSIERTVHVDSVPPKFQSNITASLPACAVSGDTLQLTFDAEEQGPKLRTYVNTSKFTDKDMQEGTCGKMSANKWKCSLNISGFSSVVGPFPRDIISEDLAGNTAKQMHNFEVCINDPNAPPNFISSITTDTVPKIDRRTASVVPVKIYVPLTINKNAGTIIDMEIDKCTAVDENNMDLLYPEQYFLTKGLSPTIALHVGFPKAVLPSEFDINCTINVKMRSGDNMFLSPEVETVVIHAETFQNPIGTLSDATNDKIDKQKAALRELDDSIDTYKSWDDILGAICSMVQIIVKINGLLQTLKSVYYGVCLALPFGIGNTIWPPVATGLNSFDRFVHKFLWPTGIDLEAWIGYIVKFSCQIYTCSFYKVSGLVSMYTDVTGLLDAVADKKFYDDQFYDDQSAQQQEALEKQLKNLEDNDKFLEEERAKLREEVEKKMLHANDEDWRKDTEKKEKEIAKLDEKKAQNEVKKQEIKKQAKIKSQVKTVDDGPNSIYQKKGENEYVKNKYDFTNKEIERLKSLHPQLYDKLFNQKGDLFAVEVNDLRRLDEKYDTNYITKLHAAGVHERILGVNSNQIGKSIIVPENYFSLDPTTLIERQSSMPQVQDKGIKNGYGWVYNTENSWLSKGRHYTYKDKNHNYYTYLDGKKVTIYRDGNKYYLNKPGTNADAKVIEDITGYGILGPPPMPVETSTFWDYVGAALPEASKQYINRNTRFYSDLESNDWIVNPYRSQHYDSFCVPAILYNMQKERQIRCKYVACLQKMENGLPTYTCDMEYGNEQCLYIESAQWKMDQSIKPILQGMLRSAIIFVVGAGTEMFYSWACSDYISMMGATKDGDFILLSPGATTAVLCGIGGAVLHYKEITSVFSGEGMKSFFASNTPDDPASIKDYCQGVDYGE